MSFTLYLQRLSAFALAQVFHPETAPAAAAQVLLPVAAVPAAGRGANPHWVGIPDLVQRLETAVAGAPAPVYELVEARLSRGLQRLIMPWPRLWRDAVTVYVADTRGMDLTDEVQLQALDRAAHAALWEAYDALYGPHTASQHGALVWCRRLPRVLVLAALGTTESPQPCWRHQKGGRVCEQACPC